MKTVIFVVISVVIILMAMQYSGKRQAQMKSQAQLCDQKCLSQGARGSEFKAAGFGDGECHCL